MFQTVRHWWQGGRGKVTARLFAFEFAVVVLGVLVAQGAADWARSQADRSDGRELVARLVETGRSLNRVSNYWYLHGPCLRRHVDRIAREAVAGHSMAMKDVGRPGLPNVSDLDLSEDDWRKVILAVGPERAQAFGEFHLASDSIQQYSTDISNEWATFKLLDSSIGPPSAEDQARVRVATAIVDNRVRWLMFNIQQVRQGLVKAGLRPDDELPNSESVVDDCGLIRNWE
jgi:hypothetical protein